MRSIAVSVGLAGALASVFVPRLCGAAEPAARVVLLVPADLDARFDPQRFLMAVQLYATDSAVASAVISDAPAASLLSAAQAQALARALSGRVAVWPTMDAAGHLTLHVADLSRLEAADTPAAAVAVMLELPAVIDAGFYRRAALKLQSALEEISRRSPTAAPSLVPPSTGGPSAEVQARPASVSENEPLTPGRRWTVGWAAVAGVGEARRTIGAALEAGLTSGAWAVAIEGGFDGRRRVITGEGRGTWTATSLRVGGRRTLLTHGDAALCAGLAVGSQWLWVDGTHDTLGRHASRLVVVPTLSAGLEGVWAVSAAGALAAAVAGTAYPSPLRILLHESEVYDSGTFSAGVRLAYRVSF